MAKKGGLGKGLDALFDEANFNSEVTLETPGVVTLRLSDIEPDKEQPRKNFDTESLTSLAESIARHGILQPIVVRKPQNEGASGILKNKYTIVAGERRWRAARMAGLSEVPVIVKNISDHEAAAIMLVENLQREDLNAVEQAKGLERLLHEFDLTQEQTAEIVGISRPALTNALRLLTLPDVVLGYLEKGDISAGHARALITLGKKDDVIKAAQFVKSKGLSVRETEKLVKKMLAGAPSKKEDKKDLSAEAYYEKLAEKISSSIGRKVTIPNRKKGAKNGFITIEYYDNDDFEKLVNDICKKDIFKD